MWSALGMPAPGTCAGPFGAWSRPPQRSPDACPGPPTSSSSDPASPAASPRLVSPRRTEGRVLEAGPRVQRAAALAQYRDALIKIPESPVSGHAVRAASGERRPRSLLSCRTARTSSASPYLRQVGGTTWHWLGTALRFVPDDFRLRSRFGVGIDWPISYDDLEPWYCEAERELGVAGDPNADLQRAAKPAVSAAADPAELRGSTDGRGVEGHARTRCSRRRRRRNSERYDNRPACCGSASCIPICPVQAKYDATTHVAQAERAGAQVVAEAVVSQRRSWRRWPHHRAHRQASRRQRRSRHRQGLRDCRARH